MTNRNTSSPAIGTIRKLNKMKVYTLSIFILISIIVSPILLMQPKEAYYGNLTDKNDDPLDKLEIEKLLRSQEDYANGIPSSENMDESLLSPDAVYPEDFDVGSFLSDNEGSYSKEWDPWLTKAAIHAIASSENIPFMEDGDMIALAGGYLYDNEVHIYRWNYVDNRYDHVWDVGDGVFKSDVLSVTFADTDYNNLTELICGCEDGRVYVFEQRHIYDPVTNMENQFDLVWTSPRMGRIFSVIVDDTDKDYRKDIIVGAGNKLLFYEYLHHGGYPFSDDHWIEYEEVFSYTLDTDITALAVSDAVENGLPEVAVGMRSGEIVLMENNGTTLPIDEDDDGIIDYYYPITQDNSYKPVWSSGNIIRRPITSMKSGNLDTDNMIEILIAAQGQGAYVLDKIDNVMGVYRLQRDYAVWESDPAGAYPFDVYLDNMVNSSNTNISTNVYYYVNASTQYPEPLNETLLETELTSIYPYKTVMAQDFSGDYTYFDANARDAWALLDFGKDEELPGSGVRKLDDLTIYLEPGSYDGTQEFTLSISPNAGVFYTIPEADISASSNKIEVDVDRTLADAELDFCRYMMINTTSGVLKVDYMEMHNINKPIIEALSVDTGSMIFPGDSATTKVGFIATMDGAILAIEKVGNEYQVVWDSYEEERWKLNKNIFSLATIKKTGRFPAIIHRGSDSVIFDTQDSFIGLPDGGDLISYDAKNFYNWRYNDDQEFIMSSSNGQFYAFRQDSPTAPLMDYDADFSNTLLNSVNNYISTELDADYYTASIVALDYTLPDEYPDVYTGLYWLFVGTWDGTLGSTDFTEDNIVPEIGEIELYSYYLYTDIIGSNIYHYFAPAIYDGSLNPAALSDLELTGQLPGLLRESTWMPKVASGDYVGTSQPDLILTNGKVHLLETMEAKNPFLAFGGEQGTLESVLVSNYFKEINENSKGRYYTNANPVDFDDDGDLDIILGFTRYDTGYFGFQKLSYGMTYFENEGTRDEPKWVEKKKAVTNNNPDTNLRVNYFCDPVMVYDDYESDEDGYLPHGYHPRYQSELPSRLMMFKTLQNHSFEGSIHQFDMSYEQPTSLLVATYPEAKRIDINLRDQTYPQATNYGFHIFETWDNEDQLREWTLSLSTADLDEDGNNEVIVGDFDNNIYVFEHLTNNTFKRAFRSFDINRTIQTSESPYAYEKFEGISGEFNRTLFDHVKYLLAGGIDLDQDGAEEFIAATDDMVFIFEAIKTVTGRIRQDSFKLVKIFDLVGLPALQHLPQDDYAISAIAVGEDLTNNGQSELLIALHSALLIFEISSEYEMEEIFFNDSFLYDGTYDTPGNYLTNPNYDINALLVDDLDQDGFMDLAIGGINRVIAKPLYKGFVTVLEWQGLEFVDIGTFQGFYGSGHVYDLCVDDSDYDGQKELLIGHLKGIDIYEFIGDNEFELRESITSNPNYPYLPTYYWKPVGSPNTLIEKDTIRLANGTLFLAYVYNKDIYLAKFNDQNKQWIDLGILIDHTYFEYDFGVMQYRVGHIKRPTFGQSPNGDIWLGFQMRYRFIDTNNPLNSVDYEYLYAIQYDDDVQAWDTFISIDSYAVSTLSLETFTYSASFYQLTGGASDRIGIVYNYPVPDQEEVKFGHVTGSDDSYSEVMIYPWVNGSMLPSHFTVATLDAVKVGYDSGTGLYKYGLVFSGYVNQEELSLDYDLFYGNFYTNFAATEYNFTRPTRVTSTGMNSFNPTIIQEQNTGNLVIAYEEATLKPFGGLWAIWSNNAGQSWYGPFDMSLPLGVDPTFFMAAEPGRPDTVKPIAGGSANSYLVRYHYYNADGKTYQVHPLTYFDSEYPVLAPEVGGGFSMVYNINLTYDKFGFPSTRELFATAINPWSNFTWFEVGTVSDLTVGDSDKDGRHEILAATGKQATLFEFASNSRTNIKYTQEWISPDYERDITAVAISDANGNGLPELIVESDRGIVHTYEITQKRTPQTDIYYPKKETVLTHGSGTGNMRIKRILPMDVNGDDTEDFIYSNSWGKIIAIDGTSLTPIYITGHNGSTEYLYADIAILYNKTTDIPVSIVSIYQDNISIFDFYSGELVDSMSLGPTGETYSAIHTANILGDAMEEILLGRDNGTLVLYDYQLTKQWKSFAPSAYPITRLDVGHFSDTSNLDIVSLSKNGYVTVYLGHNGTRLWNRTTSGIFTLAFNPSPPPTFITLYNNYWSMVLADINNDNHTDVIAGGTRTYALDGLTGAQIWNNSDGQLGSKLPITRDINKDGTLDILYGRNGGYFGTTDGGAAAMDGNTGEIIWRYDTDEYIHGDGIVDSITVDKAMNYYAGVTSSGFGYILDPLSGTASAAFPIDKSTPGTSIAISKLGFEREVILLGDLAGNISIFSVYQGHPKADRAKVETLSQYDLIDEISIGSESNHLVSDVDGDTYDEVITVSHTKISAYSIRDKTELWSYSVPSELGKYYGTAKLADVNEDGKPEVVAAYYSGIVAVTLTDGNSIWEAKFGAAHWRAGSMAIGQVDGSTGLEVVTVRMADNVNTVYLEYISGIDGVYHSIETFTRNTNPAVAIGNFRNLASGADVILTMTQENEPERGSVRIYYGYGPNTYYNANHNVIDGMLGLYYAPVSNIIVGEFSSGRAGDEFILACEFRNLGNNWPDFYLNFGTFYSCYGNDPATPGTVQPVGFTWKSNTFATPSLNHQSADLGTDGYSDVISSFENGDLLVFNGSTASSVQFKQLSYRHDIAEEYSKTKMLFGEFGKTYTFVTANYRTVTCYKDIFFGDIPEQAWSVNIKGEVIHDIGSGYFDEDSALDIVIVTRDGDLFVIYDEYFENLSKQYIEPADDLLDTLEDEIPTAIADTNFIPFYLLIGIINIIGFAIVISRRNKDNLHQ